MFTAHPAPSPPRHVVVTGASGFLGLEIVRQLLARGHRVTASGRDLGRGAELTALGAHFYPADLTRDPLPLAGADVLIHSAALSTLWAGEREYRRNNVAVSAVLARQAREAGVHLVFISSASVYNGTLWRHRALLGAPVPESLPLHGPHDSAYARSKAQAEAQVQAYHSQAVILRPRGLYGHGDPSILPPLIRALTRGRLPHLWSAGEVFTDLTHVGNAAHAAVLCAEAPMPGAGAVYNVTDTQPTGVWQTITALCGRLGVPLPSRRVDPALVEAIARLTRPLAALRGEGLHPAAVRLLTRPVRLDTTLIERELKYRPLLKAPEALALTLTQVGSRR
ncbi:NAD(P)-dependent oxidoreductase [Deinococcus sp.]|uniref:NAD-dependent epimerase/dehydratase family protein n=1 Tax=Deinococcus sp. TaxID=47478 RepID=UPI0028698EEC|nr:NAD(P)-dependent oxidoreductase [Deinococcus sp.]